MIDLLRDLSEWVVGFADSDWAYVILILNAFTESIFFPIPPDALLIGISILHPDAALFLAAIATISSVSNIFSSGFLQSELRRLNFIQNVDIKQENEIHGHNA